MDERCKRGQDRIMIRKFVLITALIAASTPVLAANVDGLDPILEADRIRRQHQVEALDACERPDAQAFRTNPMVIEYRERGIKLPPPYYGCPEARI
jgi:hypothetical protein